MGKAFREVRAGLGSLAVKPPVSFEEFRDEIYSNLTARSLRRQLIRVMMANARLCRSAGSSLCLFVVRIGTWKSAYGRCQREVFSGFGCFPSLPDLNQFSISTDSRRFPRALHVRTAELDFAQRPRFERREIPKAASIIWRVRSVVYRKGCPRSPKKQSEAAEALHGQVNCIPWGLCADREEFRGAECSSARRCK